MRLVPNLFWLLHSPARHLQPVERNRNGGTPQRTPSGSSQWTRASSWRCCTGEAQTRGRLASGIWPQRPRLRRVRAKVSGSGHVYGIRGVAGEHRASR